jgi:hypothetical protein
MNNRGRAYALGRLFSRWQAAACLAAVALAAAAIYGLWGAFSGLGVRDPSSHPIAERAAPAPAPPQRTEAERRSDREIMVVLAGARMLRESMKKPESFELLGAAIIDGNICYEYRARNSFNDRTSGHYVISKKGHSSSAKDWNRYCAGKSGTDYTSIRAVL